MARANYLELFEYTVEYPTDVSNDDDDSDTIAIGVDRSIVCKQKLPTDARGEFVC